MWEGWIRLMKTWVDAWMSHLVDCIEIFGIFLILLSLFIASLALILCILLGERRSSVTCNTHKIVAWVGHIVPRGMHSFTLTRLVNRMHSPQVLIFNALLWTFIMLTCSLVMVFTIIWLHVFDQVISISLTIFSISWINLSTKSHSLMR